LGKIECITKDEFNSILSSSEETYILTTSVIFTHSWSWAFLEKPPIVQLLKNFPAFYGSRRFIPEFRRALH
jgi:hypothetical protein